MPKIKEEVTSKKYFLYTDEGKYLAHFFVDSGITLYVGEQPSTIHAKQNSIPINNLKDFRQVLCSHISKGTLNIDTKDVISKNSITISTDASLPDYLIKKSEKAFSVSIPLSIKKGLYDITDRIKNDFKDSFCCRCYRDKKDETN